MRELGVLGSFDLITCLDDSVNYLVDDGELEAALGSFAANLAPDGVLVFDVNTVSTYRTTFARDAIVEGPGVYLVWHGECAGDEEAGCLAGLVIEAFREDGSGLYERVSTSHTQRHHPREDVEAALDERGARARRRLRPAARRLARRARGRGPSPQARLFRPARRERR